jgi:Domain of unknown function (DUF4157)
MFASLKKFRQFRSGGQNSVAPGKPFRSAVNSLAPGTWSSPAHPGSYNFGDIPLQRKKNSAQQGEISVNDPGDSFEKEADRVAEKIVQQDSNSETNVHSISEDSKITIQKKCKECEEGDDNIQRKEKSGQLPGQSVGIQQQINAERGGGQPLPGKLNSLFESRLGHDFSDVRVHASGAAPEMADKLNARAFTTGRDIFFGSGEYSPGNPDGQRLLAHELVHVVQQKSARKEVIPEVQREKNNDDDEKGSDQQKKEEDPASPHTDAGVQANQDGGPVMDDGKEKPPVSDAGASIEPEAGKEKTTAVDAGPANMQDGGQPSDNPAVDNKTDSAKPAKEDTTPKKVETDKKEETKNDKKAVPAVPADKARTVTADITAGGHQVADKGMADCPDPPSKSIIVFGCRSTPNSPPLVKEKAELPVPNSGPFGGDPDRAKFAKDLSECRAARQAQGKVEALYNDAVKEAVKNVKGVSKADTAKKVADAKAAVQRPDINKVKADLAKTFLAWLEKDYDDTIRIATKENKTDWSNRMLNNLNNAKKRLTTEKSKKPKLAKGEVAPPGKSKEDIAKEVEEDMVEIRCSEQSTILQNFSNISFAWSVARREQVDYLTFPTKAKYQKVKPTYTVDKADKVQLPANVKSSDTKEPVAPELADFFTALSANPDTPVYQASNYLNHGFGDWRGAGFSADLKLPNSTLDVRGFYRHSDAIKFVLAINDTAKTLGAKWRLLYNDFRVIKEINDFTGSTNLVFVGDAGDTIGLNYHGPSNLKLHFHLDLEIPKKLPPPAATTPATTTPTKTP